MEEEEGSFLHQRIPKRGREEEPVCESVWNNGYPVDADELNHNFKAILPCAPNNLIWNITVDGRVIRKEEGDTTPTHGALLLPPLDKVAYANYVNAIPRLRPEQITRDGIYTWIMYDGDKFVASRVETPFEIGTVHNSLALVVGARKVHGAGELKKSGGSVFFNFESGSFMKPWFSSRERKPRCSREELENYLEDKFKSLFPGAVYREKTFIKSADLPITQDVLDVYLHAGFRVIPLTAENIKKCNELVFS